MIIAVFERKYRYYVGLHGIGLSEFVRVVMFERAEPSG